MAESTQVAPNTEDLSDDRQWLEQATERYEKLLQFLDAELQRADELQEAVRQDTIRTHETAAHIESINEHFAETKQLRRANVD